ncbi:hypothetical protein ABID58_007274 [Bradyrhizobium sp. S3.2.6]
MAIAGFEGLRGGLRAVNNRLIAFHALDLGGQTSLAPWEAAPSCGLGTLNDSHSRGATRVGETGAGA